MINHVIHIFMQLYSVYVVIWLMSKLVRIRVNDTCDGHDLI